MNPKPLGVTDGSSAEHRTACLFCGLSGIAPFEVNNPSILVLTRTHNCQRATIGLKLRSCSDALCAIGTQVHHDFATQAVRLGDSAHFKQAISLGA
jgi:hypothetical protein